MKTKKMFLVISLIFGICFTLKAQELSDKQLKESVFKEINENRETEFIAFEKRISDSDSTIKSLDSEISELRKDKDKIEKLIARVQELEKKQGAINEKELSTFSFNYQTAVINLAFFESDLKPLLLLQSARNFFTTLNKISNPMSYPDYETWFASFKSYIDGAKQHEAQIAVLSELLDLTKNLTKETPLSGPVVGTLFDGIARFISTIGRDKKDLRAKSEKMMILTMVLGQYTHEISLIENEWESIDKSLEELQKLYNEYLIFNLRLIGEKYDDFNLNYISESNGMKKLEYLNKLKEMSKNKVQTDNMNYPEKWKQIFYYEMEKVQALKIRFGEITLRITQNFVKYQNLINRYENNPFLKDNMAGLKDKLNDLKNNFNKSFLPEEYIKGANTMYTIQ
jgi:hypothetical protein